MHKKAPILGRLIPRVIQDARARALIKAGNALEDQEQPSKAIYLYDSAIRLSPRMARAYLNKGNALLATADHAGALRAFEEALLLRPTYADAHFNMGNAYVRMANLISAVSAYERAIELNPDLTEAYVALGAVLDDLQRYDAAVINYRKALARKPNYAEVHCNLARSLRALGRFSEALICCRLAASIKPDSAMVQDCLGNILKDIGYLAEAEACYRRAIELEPAFVHARSSLIFLLNYSDAAAQGPACAEARQYGTLVAQSAGIQMDYRARSQTDRVLRVGFVSGDFRTHPVSFFLEAVLKKIHDTTTRHLDIFGYSNHFFVDGVTDRIKSLCDGWRVVAGLSDVEVVQRIREDAIDILIDLSGHTAHNRLAVFAHRPAPVQVSWLGYFGTTGLTTIDYVLADLWSLLPDDEVNFTECIWRLPDTRLCFTPPDVELLVGPLPAVSSGFVTFGCFNNLSKMTASVLAVWSRVLHAVPNSRLFLKSPQLADPDVMRRVLKAFAAHGIEVSRLFFEGLSSRSEYLACYQRVDIALDPFPYTGGTTTVEALWMGVPVLTLQGERFLARQGVGLLMNAGLPEWIASDTEDYVKRAIDHAADLQALAELRGALRQQVLASPLFNATDFAQHFENALRGMWKSWCEKSQKLLQK
nr:tetratricopeptide repeat protein [uncultured Rhodoferax sp.]